MHLFYYCAAADLPKGVQVDYEKNPAAYERIHTSESNANLISSEDDEGLHTPFLDIDFDAELVPSRTPGHYHLMLHGIRMPWEDYEKVINVLADVGIIEDGYRNASLARKATFLRTDRSAQ